ncbi:MAG: IPT/TIG domain-containing protein [Candidatus Xenobiia bacterium LiM19]
MSTGKRSSVAICILIIIAASATVFYGCGGGGGGGGSSGGGGGSSSSVTAPGTPTITAVTSPLISGGSCTISGSGFGSSREFTLTGGSEHHSDSAARDSSQSSISLIPVSGGSTLSPASYTSWSDSQIVCALPELAAGQQYTVVITVSNSAGSASSSSSQSSINTVPSQDTTKKPVISSISPTTQTPGQAIIITGTNYGSTQGSGSSAGYVQIGTAYVTTGLIWADTSITCTVPAGLSDGSQTVVVHTGIGGDSVGYTFTVASKKPAITKLSATTILRGATLTITGTNFGTTQDPNYVMIGTEKITTGLVWADKTISCTVPASTPTGTQNVLVHTALGGDSNSIPITVTLTVPSITKVEPASPVMGSTATITGTGFGDSQGTGSTAGYVQIGTEKITTVLTWTATSIKFTVPSTAPEGSTTMLVHSLYNGDSNELSITIISNRPVITSIAPTSAAPGASITITGTKFGTSQGSGTTMSYILFDAETQETVTSWSDTSIKCAIPAAVTPGTAVPVKVHTSAGDSDAVNMEIYSP